MFVQSLGSLFPGIFTSSNQSFPQGLPDVTEALQPLFINTETKYRGWGTLDNECTSMHNPHHQIMSAGCLSQHLYSFAIHIRYVHVHVY